MTSLLNPIIVGELHLPNRVFMAALARNRAGNPGRVPNALMREYYVQRASAGLIVSEATSIIPMGVSYADIPGIWSFDQIEGWKAITDAVHNADGHIVLQLWYAGPISTPLFLEGEQPVLPSSVTSSGHVNLPRPKETPAAPRVLETEEIPAIIEAYRQGAENARLAGFDGVEIHGANGYLLDQFLQDSTNHRKDQYGGPIENRARLMLEVTDAAIEVWGAGRVGLHLAPGHQGDMQPLGDSNPLATFSYVVQELEKRHLAFISVRESLEGSRIGPELRKIFSGVYVANEGLTKETAEKLIAEGKADAVAFGKAFIANPDLPLRFAQNAPLNEPDPETFYTPGPKGYIDYPLLTTSPQ